MASAPHFFTFPVVVIDVAVRVVASVRATDMVVVRWECVKRPAVGCVLDGGHVLAEGVPVDVVRAGASHEFFSHVVQRDDVLVACGILVALVSDIDISVASMSRENCSACTHFCAVSSERTETTPGAIRTTRRSTTSNRMLADRTLPFVPINHTIRCISSPSTFRALSDVSSHLRLS